MLRSKSYNRQIVFVKYNRTRLIAILTKIMIIFMKYNDF